MNWQFGPKPSTPSVRLGRSSSETTLLLSPSASSSPEPPLSTSVMALFQPRTRSPSPAVDPFPTQHSRYYFQDDMAVFLVSNHSTPSIIVCTFSLCFVVIDQVEDCLFRVHRYHLDRESQIFPKSTGPKDDPVELPGVTRAEFESLLNFFYDGCVPYKKPSVSLAHLLCVVPRMHNETTRPLLFWTLLLSIATRFEMVHVRSRAITEIDIFNPWIDPVDQVVLAVRHNVPKWLPQAYTAICQRADPIEIEDARKLGLETTVLLAKSRETVRNTSKSHVHVDIPRPPSCPPTEDGPSEPQYPAMSDFIECVDPDLALYADYEAQPECGYSTEVYSPHGRVVLPELICSPQLTPPLEKAPPVPLPAVAPGYRVNDDSLVRRVVNETFWPTSVPPGTSVTKVSNEITTCLPIVHLHMRQRHLEGTKKEDSEEEVGFDCSRFG
jgi:hypothetical protein